MKSTISHLNIYKDDSKQERFKKNLFGIIKSCLYLIMIDHFLKSINVYCAESSDFCFIEKESIGLTFKDRVEALNKEIYKSVLESQGRKDHKNIDEKSKLNDKGNYKPETDKSSSNSPLMEFKIFKLRCNLQSMLDYTIPDIIKDFDKDKVIQNKVFDLIKEIKSNVKSYDKKLIEKIETKMKEKQSGNSEFDKITESFIKEAKNLLLEFKISKRLFYKVMTSQSSALFPNFEDYIGFKLSEVDLKREQLFKGLVFCKLAFSKEKSRADSIVMILTKVLELTPGEFKRDEEVLKAILSLND